MRAPPSRSHSRPAWLRAPGLPVALVLGPAGLASLAAALIAGPVWAGVGLALLAAAALAATSVSRRLGSQRRALSAGPRVPARVTRHRIARYGPPGQSILFWETDTGLAGRSDPHPTRSLPAPGAALVVALDPARPLTGWWERDLPAAPPAQDA